MKKLLWLLLLLAFVLTACAALPQQTDAADEAIVRVVTLSRGEGELKLVGMTAGIKTADTDEPPEKVEGSGEDYLTARDKMEEERQVSLTHATDWVVEENAVGDALQAFVEDPELTYDAHVYIVKEQSAQEFLDAFGEEQTGPAKALDDLGRALGERGVTMLELSRALAAGERCEVPVIKAENGEVDLVEYVEWKQWK